MNLDDIFVKHPRPKSAYWQLGNLLVNDIKSGSVVLIFCSDFRGGGKAAAEPNYGKVREYLYTLSRQDWDFFIYDAGDITSGKTPADTQYILQEVFTFCLKKNALPILIGGSADLAHAVFSAVNHLYKDITFTQISPVISLENEGEISEKNFLAKILSAKEFSVKNYHHLGYQKHLSEFESVQMLKNVEFDVVRLAEMMNSTTRAEPYFRRADVVTVNCDAVESFSEAFSQNPQVNGLNRREICSYMHEAGLSENLKAAGIFNFNQSAKNELNHQLLAQMIWYLLEGIYTQRTHPKKRSYETFWVLVGENQYSFKRDTFSNLWYFGEDEDINNCIPCSREDFDEAKKGFLNPRFIS